MSRWLDWKEQLKKKKKRYREDFMTFGRSIEERWMSHWVDSKELIKKIKIQTNKQKQEKRGIEIVGPIMSADCVLEI